LPSATIIGVGGLRMQFSWDKFEPVLPYMLIVVAALLVFLVLAIPSWILDRKGYSSGKTLAVFLASTFLGLWLIMLIVALLVPEERPVRKRRAA
jgi:hypothetical protein